jgi:hypothetical protein
MFSAFNTLFPLLKNIAPYGVRKLACALSDDTKAAASGKQSSLPHSKELC